MPCDFVFVVLESNVTVPVVGHDDYGLVIGQEYAVAATASHNAFDWLYRTAQMVHRFTVQRKPGFAFRSATVQQPRSGTAGGPF